MLQEVQGDCVGSGSRWSNVVKIAPWPDALLPGASVTLSLDHEVKIISKQYPARLRIALTGVRRRFSAGESNNPITALIPAATSYTVPPPLIELSRLQDSVTQQLSEFDITYLSETIRITRGASSRQELRIFERVDVGTGP